MAPFSLVFPMSVSIAGINQAGFEALVYAANAAYEEGRLEAALLLDNMARRANAALARESTDAGRSMGAIALPRQNLPWQDVPSVLPAGAAATIAATQNQKRRPTSNAASQDG